VICLLQFGPARLRNDVSFKWVCGANKKSLNIQIKKLKIVRRQYSHWFYGLYFSTSRACFLLTLKIIGMAVKKEDRHHPLAVFPGSDLSAPVRPGPGKERQAAITDLTAGELAALDSFIDGQELNRESRKRFRRERRKGLRTRFYTEWLAHGS
jgi:hypothetical protein